jgi:hypothetical protein
VWWLAACVNVVVAPADWPEVTVPATTTGGCAPTGDADITAFSAIPGRLSNQVALRVTTAGDVPVAVRCTLVGGDGEVHLLEDDGGTDHVSHLSGLLPDSVYTCEASATCPRTASPPEPLTVVTGPAPGALAPVRVTLDERVGVSGDYTLFNLNSGGGCTPGGWLQVVDLQGRPRFWHPLPAVGVDVEARFHGDDVFVFGGGETPDGRPRAVTVWDGQVYDSAVVLDDADTRVFHHDGKRLPDGRLMTLELRQNDAPGLGRFEGFAVRVLDPRSRAVEWEWSSQTAVDRGQLPVTSGGDEWHANWADVVVERGRDVLYVSLCYSGWILRIDPASGDVEWVLGAGGDFELVDWGGAPLDPWEFSQCQHGIDVDGDRLVLYDNGWGRGYSRASAYEVDADAGIARLLWTFEDGGWYHGTLGDADWLPGGHVLVTRAYASCWDYGDHGEIVEFDPASGAVAARLELTRREDAIYRAERIDGCDLFADVATCPARAARAAELDPAFRRAP